MKAIKGCVNRECNSYKKRVHYKESFEFCPQCSVKIEYVCSSCWKVLEQNHNRLCIACKAEQEQKREQQFNQIKGLGIAIAGVGKIAWDKREVIIDGAKKAAKFFKK